MAKEIIMPKMGNTVESVILGEIQIKIGEQIKPGDILFEYETDKSTTEFKSEDSGEVLAILYQEGDEVPVLKPIIIVGEKGEDISKWESAAKEEAKAEEKTEANPKVEETPKQEEQTNNNTTISNQSNGNFSPRALKTASNLGVDPNTISTGSGANARVIEKDVISTYYSNKKAGVFELPGKPEFEHVPYTPIRVAIAKVMESSIQTGAQLTLMAPFDATQIMQLRAMIKANAQKYPERVQNSSVNDIFIYVLSRILPKFPHINSIINPDNSYDAYNVAHISVAVDAPKGLLVPVVKNASFLSLNEITAKTKELIGKAKIAKLSASEQKGGTFTISNLGLSGVMGFTPILNPPQSAILGVGSPINRLKLDKNGTVKEYKEITLSLTMDHRPYDGAQGAEFLKELTKALENVLEMFIF